MSDTSNYVDQFNKAAREIEQRIKREDEAARRERYTAHKELAKLHKLSIRTLRNLLDDITRIIRPTGVPLNEMETSTILLNLEKEVDHAREVLEILDE